MAKYSDAAMLVFKILSDKPVAYHPRLAKSVGGVKEAIFVCQLLYWDDKGSKKDGWVYKTQSDIENETGLSRYEQETVRKKLKKIGVLEEVRKGVPATMHFRINFDILFEKINETYNPSLQKHHILDCGNAADKNAEVQQSLNTENTQKNTTQDKVCHSCEVKDKLNENGLCVACEVLGKPHNSQKNGRTAQDVIRDGPLTVAKAISHSNKFHDYPEELIPWGNACVENFPGISFPSKRQKSRWIEGLRNLRDSCGKYGIRILLDYANEYREYMIAHNGVAPFPASHPQALVKTLKAKVDERENALVQTSLFEEDGGFYGM